MEKVAVVILNWNGIKYLKQFLPSVIKYTPSALIVIADNNSTDDSVEFVRSSFPSVQIIAFTENNGFCEGYNKALAQIKAEYYIILNSDVEVTENWLPPLLQLMEADKSIAACQPKIKSWHNKKLFEYAGAAGGYIDKFGYPFCRGRVFDTLEEDEGQYNDTKQVFWASGACLLIRSECFTKTGGFDPLFFAHMEEIDLCWRLNRMGYKIVACGKSEVFHVGGGTLPHNNPKKTYLNFRNNLILLYKNLPSKHFIGVIFLRLLLDGLAGFRFLLSFSFGHILAILKAHLFFYYNFRVIAKKKKEFKEEVGVDLSNIIYQRLSPIQYFVFKRRKFRELPKYPR